MAVMAPITTICKIKRKVNKTTRMIIITIIIMVIIIPAAATTTRSTQIDKLSKVEDEVVIEVVPVVVVTVDGNQN